MKSPLQGLRLWVTRPREQADGLIATLSAEGAEVLALPLLEIVPPRDPAPLEAALARLDNYDMAVFVSPSALDAVLSRLPAGWPETIPAAVMGPGSAQRARQQGLAKIIAPSSQFDSDGLLQLAEMQQLSGQRIVLFRGDGGRETLPETLRARGAELTIICAYHRQPPAFDADYLLTQLSAGCDGMIVSSSEAVHYLFDVGGGAARQELQSVLYFAPHPRIVAALNHAGAVHVALTAVGDTGITETILNHFSPNQHRAFTAKNTHDAG